VIPLANPPQLQQHRHALVDNFMQPLNASGIGSRQNVFIAENPVSPLRGLFS
jgi:hypothetical protein